MEFDIKLKPCPFCGGSARIVVCDDMGNIHGEDYRNDPWSGLTFGIVHDGSNAGVNCPIAMFKGDGTIGRYGYDTEEEAIAVWNMRAPVTEIQEADIPKREIVDF